MSERFREFTRRNLVKLATSAGLGMLAVLAMDESHLTTDRLGLKVDIETVQGGTTTIDTPLGDRKLPLRAGPFALDIGINGISFENALDLLQDTERLGQVPEDLNADLEQIKKEAKSHIKRDLFVFTLGSFAGWMLGEGLTRKDKMGRKILTQGALRALMAASLLTSSLYVSAKIAYDGNASKKAVDSRGFAFIKDNSDLLTRLDKHDETVAKTVEGFLRFSHAVNQLGEEERDPSFSIMIVADNHSRYIAPLLKTIIETNDVDAVIDAGDITEGIFPSESDFFTKPSLVEQWRNIKEDLSNLGVPIYIVKGNHDTKETMTALDTLPNVTVLDGQVEEVGNLKIIGIGDPEEPADTVDQTARELLNNQLTQRLQYLISQYRPDLAVVHNNSAAAKISGGVRLVISGHSHVCEPQLNVLDSGTIQYNQGSSGGAFLRALQPNDCGAESEEQPQTISIMRFNQLNQPYAVDEFVITSLDSVNIRINHRGISCSGDCAV